MAWQKVAADLRHEASSRLPCARTDPRGGRRGLRRPLPRRRPGAGDAPMGAMSAASSASRSSRRRFRPCYRFSSARRWRWRSRGGRVFPAAALFIAALNLASVLPAIVAAFGIVAVARPRRLGRRGARACRPRPRRLALRAPGHPDRPRLLQCAARRARLPRRALGGSRRAVAACRAARHAAGRDLSADRLAGADARGAGALPRSSSCSASRASRSCSRSAAGRARQRLRSRSTRPCASTWISPAPALLALLQVALSLSLALPILWLARRPAESAALGLGTRRPGRGGRRRDGHSTASRLRRARSWSCRRSSRWQSPASRRLRASSMPTLRRRRRRAS